MRRRSASGRKRTRQYGKLYEFVLHHDLPVSQLKEHTAGRFNYGDFFRLRFEEQTELIGGRIFRMYPAPSLSHQRLCGLLYVKLHDYLSDHQAEVFIHPFDVRLTNVGNTDDEIETVVRPDLCVVCDPAKLDERGCVGPPDIVIEVLSDGNNWRELIDKFKVYEEAGVKEYWVISQKRKHFFVYNLNRYRKFQSTGANRYKTEVMSAILPGLKLNLNDLLSD